MPYDVIVFPVCTLQSACIDYVANNLHCLLSQINTISRLPGHIKDRILHKISVSLYFWRKLNVKLILQSLIHPHTKQVDLTFCLVEDELLSTLKICRNLKELHLTQTLNTSLTSEGLLDLFPYLKELRMLRLAKCNAVNDEVVICIAKNCPKLAGLDLHSCTNITDKALDELGNLENLLWMTLSNTKISDSGVESVVKGPSGPKLKEFRLADCANLTGQVLPVIIANCPSLEVFVFHGCKMIQDTELLELSLKGLKQIQYTIEW